VLPINVIEKIKDFESTLNNKVFFEKKECLASALIKRNHHALF